MNEEQSIKRLKRVHDSAVNAEKKSAPTVVDEFNSILAELHDAFPQNSYIHSVDPITEDVYTPVTAGVENYITEENALEKVKLKTEQMADSLDLDNGFKRTTDRDSLPQIVINQESTQSNVQQTEQKVDVESVMKMVEYDPQVKQNQEDVKQLIRDFQQELEEENPDPSLLREFLQEAKGYSASIAAKLAILGVEHGVIEILGLE